MIILFSGADSKGILQHKQSNVRQWTYDGEACRGKPLSGKRFWPGQKAISSPKHKDDQDILYGERAEDSKKQVKHI